MENRFVYRKAGGYNATEIANLALGCATIGGAYVKALINEEAGFMGVVATGLENENDYTYNSTANAGSGSVTGAGLPPNVTLAISLLTAKTGRSARGRFYTVAMSESQIDEPAFALLAYANAWEDAMSIVKANALTIGWQQVVLSRFHNGAKRGVAIAEPVVSIRHHNLVLDSQRGRLP